MKSSIFTYLRFIITPYLTQFVPVIRIIFFYFVKQTFRLGIFFYWLAVIACFVITLGIFFSVLSHLVSKPINIIGPETIFPPAQSSEEIICVLFIIVLIFYPLIQFVRKSNTRNLSHIIKKHTYDIIVTLLFLLEMTIGIIGTLIVFEYTYDNTFTTFLMFVCLLTTVLFYKKISNCIILKLSKWNC